MPRKITNKFGLPETLLNAITYDTHKTHGTISCTELIDAPQVRILKKKHEYETDVVDNLYALMGTALHHILERANIESVKQRAFIMTAETIMSRADELMKTDPTNGEQFKKVANYIFSLIPYFFPELQGRYIFEKTMSLELKGGHVLSMTFDLYDTHTGILWDYKFCSVYQYLYPESREKWYQQTNVYAYGLNHEGHTVNGIKILAFFRDWSQYDLMRNKDYPRQQIIEVNVPLGNPNDPLQRHWTTQIEEYIGKRIDIHIAAENGDVRECNGKDRWATSNSWAVKKVGNKKAVRVFNIDSLAKEFITENAHRLGKLSLEFRPGVSRRCEKYCPVSKFCPQYAEEKKRIQELSLEDNII